MRLSQFWIIHSMTILACSNGTPRFRIALACPAALLSDKGVISLGYVVEKVSTKNLTNRNESVWSRPLLPFLCP